MVNKITSADLSGKGVIGLPDTPGLTTEAMQAKFEETARDVIIPRFNALIDAILAETASGVVGAKDPQTAQKTTVQAVLAALYAALQERAKAADVYTKSETQLRITQAVNDKVADIGAGDMAQAVYDPQGKKADVFAGIAEAKSEALTAQRIADAAMPKDGGAFIGGVAAYSTNRTAADLRNIEVEDSAGNKVSTDKIVFVRR